MIMCQGWCRVCTDKSCSHYVNEASLQNESRNRARRYLGMSDVSGELSKSGGKADVHCVCSTIYDVELRPDK